MKRARVALAAAVWLAARMGAQAADAPGLLATIERYDHLRVGDAVTGLDHGRDSTRKRAHAERPTVC